MLGFATAIRNARAQTVADFIDAGNQAGILEIYSGARPTTGGALVGNVLLGTLVFAKPCISGVAEGLAAFSTITADTSADATGTATWFRISSRNSEVSTFVMDGSITATGGNGDITLNTVSLVEGGPIFVSGAPQLLEGNA